MRAIAPSSVDDIPQLQSETYKALPLTKSGPALNETLVVSQKMVAYLASFLGTSCFVRSLDPRVEGRLDRLYANAIKKLSEVKDAPFSQYLCRKWAEWHRRFPIKVQGKGAAADDDDAGGEGGEAAGEEEEEIVVTGDALALSGDEK